MMDLSGEVRDVLSSMKLLIKESEQFIDSRRGQYKNDFRIGINSNELIDINKVEFYNDEIWLYESPIKNSDVKDLKAWLYQEFINIKDIDYHSTRLSFIRDTTQTETKKSIDTRTFTRPKKRISRPSIEHYNEGYFKMDKTNTSFDNKYFDNINNTTIKLNETIENVIEENPDSYNNLLDKIENTEMNTSHPLNFDYSQPTSSSIFDKIVASAPDVDSFQNMSPPSLVNSMCSSTFTNLMENSYIKNDPALREIRDAELTEAMLQDYDPPIFKSFTDSCSSIGSDTLDSKRINDFTSPSNITIKQNVTFDKESSLNETFTPGNTGYLDCTYRKDLSPSASSTNVCLSSETIIQSASPYHQTIYTNPDSNCINNSTTLPSILNGTFKKNTSAKLNDTFRKYPQYKSSSELINDDLNRTITIVDNNDSNRLNNTKRHSFILDNHKSESNHVTNLKRNSIAFSAGSTDSLDYSSLSSSSKGSNKMLNMAEVDAIVFQQEQSLQQVMSTPKRTSKTTSKLWENNYISPIRSTQDNLSDSEASSNDDFRTVGSNASTLTPYESEMHEPMTNKSLENFKQPVDLPKVSPKSLNAIPAKTLSNKHNDNRFRGSYTNLKTVGTQLKGSYTNLKMSGANIKGSYTNLTSAVNNMRGSTTNLKTMSSNLKASYTKLKPVLTDLPDAHMKIFDPNATTILSKQSVNLHANAKVAEVAPTLRDIAPKSQVNSANIKPQSKASGLPRPVSAIPRPTGSRIPCPRNDRPASQRLYNRPVSRVTLDGDF